MKKQPVTIFVMVSTEMTSNELSLLKENLQDKKTSGRKTIESLKSIISLSHLSERSKKTYITTLEGFSTEDVERVFASASTPLTNTDRKYVTCFMMRMSTLDICSLFHVEPASVYVVRYRVKKKFSNPDSLPF